MEKIVIYKFTQKEKEFIQELCERGYRYDMSYEDDLFRRKYSEEIMEFQNNKLFQSKNVSEGSYITFELSEEGRKAIFQEIKPSRKAQFPYWKVLCVSRFKQNTGCLTIGKTYDVIRTVEGLKKDRFYIVDDNGVIKSYVKGNSQFQIV